MTERGSVIADDKFLHCPRDAHIKQSALFFKVALGVVDDGMEERTGTRKVTQRVTQATPPSFWRNMGKAVGSSVESGFLNPYEAKPSAEPTILPKGEASRAAKRTSSQATGGERRAVRLMPRGTSSAKRSVFTSKASPTVKI